MTLNPNGITRHFGTNLAKILGDKIVVVYPEFNFGKFIKLIEKRVIDKSYTERIIIFAETLHELLPASYPESIAILVKILGPENPNETGMFKEFYWILPIGKFVELYGLDHYSVSIKALEEITKRNTAEYAVRPFIKKYPEKMLQKIKSWTVSKNFHLRRLASEGLRPKLPWATKLDIFIQDPKPVFEILELLKTDNILFVKKSVANNVRDYLKVNKEQAEKLLQKWSKTDNKNTLWIIKHATRKMNKE